MDDSIYTNLDTDVPRSEWGEKVSEIYVDLEKAKKAKKINFTVFIISLLFLAYCIFAAAAMDSKAALLSSFFILFIVVYSSMKFIEIRKNAKYKSLIQLYENGIFIEKWNKFFKWMTCGFCCFGNTVIQFQFIPEQMKQWPSAEDVEAVKRFDYISEKYNTEVIYYTFLFPKYFSNITVDEFDKHLRDILYKKFPPTEQKKVTFKQKVFLFFFGTLTPDYKRVAAWIVQAVFVPPFLFFAFFGHVELNSQSAKIALSAFVIILICGSILYAKYGMYFRPEQYDKKYKTQNIFIKILRRSLFTLILIVCLYLSLVGTAGIYFRLAGNEAVNPNNGHKIYMTQYGYYEPKIGDKK